MSPSDLSIENINEKELLEIIEKGKVDLDILKSRGMATIENLNYLYLLDRITIAELAIYKSLNRTTVYRQVMKDQGVSILQIKEVYESCKTITVRPKNVFDNIYDYEDFLKWRAERKNGKKTVSIKDTMEITGLSRRQITILIQRDELVAIKKESGTYEVLNSSLSLFLIEHLISAKNKMGKAAAFLCSNGNEVSIKLHIGGTSI